MAKFEPRTDPAYRSEIKIAPGRGQVPWAMTPQWVISAEEISPGAKTLYTVLCGLLPRDENSTYGSRAILAGIIGCGERSIKTWSEELVQIGAIEVCIAPTLSGRANVYIIHHLPPEGYTGAMSLWERRSQLTGKTGSSGGVRQNLPDPAGTPKHRGGPAKSAGRVRQNLPDGSGKICRPIKNKNKNTQVCVDEKTIAEAMRRVWPVIDMAARERLSASDGQAITDTVAACLGAGHQIAVIVKRLSGKTNAATHSPSVVVLRALRALQSESPAALVPHVTPDVSSVSRAPVVASCPECGLAMTGTVCRACASEALAAGGAA